MPASGDAVGPVGVWVPGAATSPRMARQAAAVVAAESATVPAMSVAAPASSSVPVAYRYVHQGCVEQGTQEECLVHGVPGTGPECAHRPSERSVVRLVPDLVRDEPEDPVGVVIQPGREVVDGGDRRVQRDRAPRGLRLS